jgi:hypothetical protein
MTKKKIARSKQATKGSERRAGKGGASDSAVRAEKPEEQPVDAEIRRAARRAGLEPERRAAAILHQHVGQELIRACDLVSSMLAELDDPGDQILDRLLELNAALWKARWSILVDSTDVRAVATSEHVAGLLFDRKPLAATGGAS